MLEYHFGERIPEVVFDRKRFHRNEFTPARFFLHTNLHKLADASRKTIRPADFLALTHLIATDVLNVEQNRARLFLRFPESRLHRTLVRLDSAARNAPAPAMDVAK